MIPEILEIRLPIGMEDHHPPSRSMQSPGWASNTSFGLSRGTVTRLAVAVTLQVVERCVVAEVALGIGSALPPRALHRDVPCSDPSQHQWFLTLSSYTNKHLPGLARDQNLVLNVKYTTIYISARDFGNNLTDLSNTPIQIQIQNDRLGKHLT